MKLDKKGTMILDYPRIYSFLSDNLSEKEKEVVSQRFGLEHDQRKTLEKIGNGFGLTRERIRQIELNALSKMREKKQANSLKKIFSYFEDYLKEQGGLKREDILLADLGGRDFQNFIYLFLIIGDPFYHFRESTELYSFWTIEQALHQKAETILGKITRIFEKEKKPFPENDFFQFFKNENTELFLSIVEIAKRIEKGPLNQFGLTDWPEIKPKGVRDKAYLTLKKIKKPLHFRKLAELASRIESECCASKKVFPQTVHNELIRDERFVLIGRGIYALKEWGYKTGTVRDVIADILKTTEKPLTKKEIIKQVLGQRMVKKNTILLNLQDKSLFSKDSQGRCRLR